MVHSCKLQGHIKHEWEEVNCVLWVLVPPLSTCSSGILMQAPRAYKAWVGGLLRRCGTLKHEWEGYLGDVGLQRCGVKGYKAKPLARRSVHPEDPTPSWQIREGLAPQSGQTLLNGRASTHRKLDGKIASFFSFFLF